MWNVDYTGSRTSAGLTIRQAVQADAPAGSERLGIIFGKYLSQLLLSFEEGQNFHVVTTGSITTTGASGVTFACEVVP